MKRSQLQRKSPLKQGGDSLKRSAFKASASTLKTTKPLQAKEPMKRATAPMKARKAAKDKPKRTARENHAIRQSARGQDCTICIPGVCNRNPETVVWCHENSFAAGKGMGIKARCEHGAYGCSACHAVFDGQISRPPGLTKEDVDTYFARGKYISRQILVHLKILLE